MSTATLVELVAARQRQRLADRMTFAADHLRLLAENGLTEATCPVCDDCPDWITNPPRRHP